MVGESDAKDKSAKETLLAKEGGSATLLADPCVLFPGRLNLVHRPGWPTPVASVLPAAEKTRRCAKVAAECIQEAELLALFETKAHPICYDGFEPSGRMHIAQGVLKSMLVNELTECGCVFVFWVADWFALLNGKMGGDLAKIKRVGQYFIHVWTAAGMNMDNVRFVWTSEEIARDSANYWLRVIDISRRNTINRIKRCSQIMGRHEGDDQPASQMMYPCMQCADIFYIGADICQLGMDQRKVNMLAREYADDWNATHKSRDKLSKPVILSHAMMPGLLEGQEKMSKSIPDSAIFVEDTKEDVNRKIKRAYCPPQTVENNPIINYIKALVFPKYTHFKIERSEINGGDIKYDSYEAFETDYVSGKLHPGDIKPALATALNTMLQPIRDYFQTNAEAKAVLADVKRFQSDAAKADAAKADAAKADAAKADVAKADVAKANATTITKDVEEGGVK